MLIERYKEAESLVDALRNQAVTRGSEQISRLLAQHGSLVQFEAGQVLVRQGDTDRDVYFLIAGRVQIIINGFRMYTRAAGVSVGEISAINPAIPRTATLEALETVVAWKMDHRDFLEVCDANPAMWRLLAVEMSSRLDQRNSLVNRANQRPSIFVISSTESLAYARAIRVGLEHTADVELWSDEEIFKAGSYPLEALERQVAIADFGIALAEPDDLVTSRGEQLNQPRDNVLFELGFFMSRLGRHRTLLVVPRMAGLKLPSDFKGLTPLSYERGAIPSKALGPTIDKITNTISTIGVRASLIQSL